MKPDSERKLSGGATTVSSENLHRAQRCKANDLKTTKTCRNHSLLLQKKILDRFRTTRHANNFLHEFGCSRPGGRFATRWNDHHIWVAGIDPGLFFSDDLPCFLALYIFLDFLQRVSWTLCNFSGRLPTRVRSLIIRLHISMQNFPKIPKILLRKLYDEPRADFPSS